MSEGNGVPSRREFDRLDRQVEELEKRLNKIDRDGSAANQRLTRDVDEMRGTLNWVIRGFIASLAIALVVWVVIQGQGTP